MSTWKLPRKTKKVFVARNGRDSYTQLRAAAWAELMFRPPTSGRLYLGPSQWLPLLTRITRAEDTMDRSKRFMAALTASGDLERIKNGDTSNMVTPPFAQFE